MNCEEELKRLCGEQESLVFGKFDFEDAYAIGQRLVENGCREKMPIAIDISVAGRQLFHASLPGASPDNDFWIIRKNRVVSRFHKSSYFVAVSLRSKGKTIEEAYGLSSAEYAPWGGAVPISVKGGGIIGTVTVSGLPDVDDHAVVVEAIRHRLESCRA